MGVSVEALLVRMAAMCAMDGRFVELHLAPGEWSTEEPQRPELYTARPRPLMQVAPRRRQQAKPVYAPELLWAELALVHPAQAAARQRRRKLPLLSPRQLNRPRLQLPRRPIAAVADKCSGKKRK
jgi:hypothetical protein